MDIYDTGRMRSCADEIRRELHNHYQKKKEDTDNVVNLLKNNWKDTTNDNYSRKYNSEAKTAAENVEKLMEAYAKLLDSAAEEYERVHRQANTDMG